MRPGPIKDLLLAPLRVGTVEYNPIKNNNAIRAPSPTRHRKRPRQQARQPLRAATCRTRSRVLTLAREKRGKIGTNLKLPRTALEGDLKKRGEERRVVVGLGNGAGPVGGPSVATVKHLYYLKLQNEHISH